MTLRARRAALGLALAALLAAPGAPSLEAPRAEALPEASEREPWQERVAEARELVLRAQERRDAAETAVERMRHSRHPRGEAREALFAEREAARLDVAEAERALEELLEEARRAGVPPGWLRAPAAQSDAAPAAEAPE
jgi:hypothetical protein